MSSLQKAFAAFTGASMIGSLTQVAKGKLTAVVLGPEGVGVLAQLTGVWSLFSVVSGFGFYNGMVRHLAGHWHEEDRAAMRRHMSSSALFLLGISLMLALLGVIFSPQISALVFDDAGARTNLVALILISIPVFVMSQVYRAMLNATRSVNAIVRARIYADVSSVVVLAVLIWPLGMVGAIMGYIGLHLLFLTYTVWFTHHTLGADLVVPSARDFRWSDIRRNLGFGISGLIAAGIGILTMLTVSRWIILDLGLAQAGIYAMALKVSSVYLGGLSGAAGGYYFPTLAASKTNCERDGHINATLSLYMYLIPPIIVVLMAGGDIMMLILFSAEFIPAAALLLLLLPGDLFRIAAETMAMPLLVEKRLVIHTGLYGFWAALYLGFAAWLMPQMGSSGAALAYVGAQAIYVTVVFFTLQGLLGYKISAGCVQSLLRGLALVGTVAFVQWTQDRWIGYGLSTALLLVWSALSMRDPAFAKLAHSGLYKLGLARARNKGTSDK